ncbi:MAG TPA: ROK family protein [Roseiflexaceae bacterium]|nr:ROK family protein [Roseiflexaceae bacterium]
MDCAIGIDVGGTKIAGGVVDLAAGRVLARRAAPTRPERGGAAVLEDALALAYALRDAASGLGLTPRGVGVGVCELVDQAGNVTSGHTVAWAGLPVRARFAEVAPAVVEADVRAHALAEARYGAGQPFRLFAFVTVGTGISSCLVIDGRPFAGARGNALILASSPLSAVCERCGALNRPVLEEFAGGPGLVARYNEQAGARAQRAEEVLAAAAGGDVAAAEVVRSAGFALGVSLGWLVNVLDPEALIIGGGLGTAGGLYWDTLVDAARAHIWAGVARGLPIIPAALGPDAGLIGAAAATARR